MCQSIVPSMPTTRSTTIQLPDAPLPTLTRLNATLPPDIDAVKVAQDWFSTFSVAIESKDARALSELLLPNSFWRDILALTWEFRTFRGQDKIVQFLGDRLPIAKMQQIKLRHDFLGLQQPYPDLAWINAFFDFETCIGTGSGIVRLVPTQDGKWKAHVVFTNLEDLKGFPEKIGPLRDPERNHRMWAQQRQKEAEFEDKDPAVLIIGAGQSGVILSARLKAMGVSALMVDRSARIGGCWWDRYEVLSLHSPVWYDHMPYMPFPSTWPMFSPGLKLASWLEHYSEAMELPVWTSTNILHASQDKNNKWHVKLRRSDGTERTLVVNHLVFATGFVGAPSELPEYPGHDKFKGQILHSTQYHRALDHAGKKVVIVGACTSAHDIAEDCYYNGVDVTIIQRGPTHIMTVKNGWEVLFKGLYDEEGPPTDIADRIGASFPLFMATEFNQRRIKQIAELDREILDGLTRVGFKLTGGIEGTGFALLALTRGGGYYLDTGACQLIIDRKIKLWSRSTISEITETGLKFADGSELPADVIIFATGLGDTRDIVRQVCGDEIANRTKQIWGVDSEGEVSGTWRDLGVPNMWYMTGGLSHCRFHSKHLALQIKAIEEGITVERYSPQE